MRLKILDWLKKPADEFPAHESGLGFDQGVCVAYIQKKAGISQSTTSQYMSQLQQAGLVKSKRIGKWTYYQRNEERLIFVAQELYSVITNRGAENE
jgi:ArsR family transcriptional regulator